MLYKYRGADSTQYAQVFLDPLESERLIDNNLIVQNSLTVPKVTENYSYITDKGLPVSNLRTAAFKLGFTVEHTNSSTGLYSLSKTEDISTNSLLINLKKGTFTFRSDAGIDSPWEKNEEHYKKLTEYFGLASFDISNVSKVTRDNFSILTYNVSYNGKPVIFEIGSPFAAIITVKEKKVVDVFMRIISSSTLSKDRNIKPLKEINSNNIKNGLYTAKAVPNETTSGGPQGYESSVTGTVTANLKDYKDCYYYHFEQIGEKVMLLPAYQVNGDYVDRAFAKGKLNLVVVNQDPSIISS